MWEWSKDVVAKINSTKCLGEGDLHQIELATRLFETMTTIQSLRNREDKVVMKPLNEKEFEDKISDWANAVILQITKANCLNKNDLLAVEASLVSMDIYDAMLNESLQLNKTNWFEFEHNSYMKEELA